MRRAGSLAMIALLLWAVFYIGRLYERHQCQLDLPRRIASVGDLVNCRQHFELPVR